MILQLFRQLNNLDRSKTIACSASFCFGLSLRFPCPLPKRISSRILSKSMFIRQSHPKSQQRVRTCAVIEKPVFRASLAQNMLEIELYQIFIPYDRGRSGYEIKAQLQCFKFFILAWNFSTLPLPAANSVIKLLKTALAELWLVNQYISFEKQRWQPGCMITCPGHCTWTRRISECHKKLQG